jgi:hypothetical protein
MELSLLTGVQLMVTFFDKEEGKITQYLSDSVEVFESLKEIDDKTLKMKFLRN